MHQGGRGQSFVYELLYDDEGQDGRAFVMGLINIKQLENTLTTTSSRGKSTQVAGSTRPQSGAKTGGKRADKTTHKASPSKASKETDKQTSENAPLNKNNHASYRSGSSLPLTAEAEC